MEDSPATIGAGYIELAEGIGLCWMKLC